MTEREQFEAWLESQCRDATRVVAPRQPNADGGYANSQTHVAWLAWQAARAAAPAQDTPRESSTGTADAPALVPNSKEKPPAAPAQTAQQRFDTFYSNEVDGTDPVERLRAFCSFAMNGQDWLDVEPFFDALTAAPAEPVARLLHWCGPAHYTVPHDGLAARTFKEFTREDAAKPDSYWKDGEPLYASPPRSAEWVAEAMRLFDQSVVDAWNAGEEGRDYIADVRAARAALEVHLKGQE